jgi:hypothetical protein
MISGKVKMMVEVGMFFGYYDPQESSRTVYGKGSYSGWTFH